jgi:hypothetical protein
MKLIYSTEVSLFFSIILEDTESFLLPLQMFKNSIMLAVGLLHSELVMTSNFSFLINVESVTLNCHIISYIISNIISYLFLFHGSLQGYKLYMDMEIVNTVHDSDKNMCLIGEDVESVLKCTAVLVAGPGTMFEDLM